MFEDPSGFIKFLKQKYAEPFLSLKPTDQKFHEITEEQLKKHGVIEAVRRESLDWVVKEIFGNVIDSLVFSEKQKVQECIGIGVVQTGEINAFIAKGGSNIYGIILNVGLMLLLNKAYKLTIASIFPEGVVYCNRGNPLELKMEDYWLMFEELCEIYIDKGAPYGPMIKLSDELLGKTGDLLYIGEAFIICHEIAHFLNGDLNDESAFLPLGRIDNVTKFIEGKKNEKEFKADVKGYQLLSDMLNAKYPKLKGHLPIWPIISLMDVLAAVGVRETYHHPSPEDRVINIAESCFGSETAQILKNSYSLAKSGSMDDLVQFFKKSFILE